MFSARARRGLELALFLGLTFPLLREWFETSSASSRLSYALLVPVLALVLALRASREGPARAGRARASRTRGGTPSAPWAFLTAATFLLGSLSGVFTLTLLAVPLGAIAFVARAKGHQGLRRFAPALALLFLMVPPPMPLLDRINPFLVAASGETAVRLLAPFDPEVGWAGTTLLFQGWTLIVAEACSGSGTFLMLGTLCTFLAALFHLRAGWAMVLMAAALPVTLLVNGVRIASSALIISHFGAAAGEGLPHELLGQGVVLLGAALLVFVVERGAPRPARELVAKS